MPRPPRDDRHLNDALDELVAVGEGAPSLDEKTQLATLIAGRSPQSAESLTRFLLEQVTSYRSGLIDARRYQNELRDLLRAMGEPPWYPAVFVTQVETSRGRAAIVHSDGGRRLVTIADDVDLRDLVRGTEVYLGPQKNRIVASTVAAPFLAGETVSFDRPLDSDRLIVRSRDEEFVTEAAGSLSIAELRSGDLLRWNREVGMVFERIARSEGVHLFLEDTPSQTFADIGGLDCQIREIQEPILLHLRHKATAQLFRLKIPRSVTLKGRPGVGKTMIARATANWLATLVPSGRSRFINIKPGSLNSVWYGQTEANYREIFRVARELAEREPGVPVVIFFDEIDSVGAARDASLMRVDHRVLTSLMAELDGFEDRGNVLVMAATNRADALDQALVRPGRMGDLVIDIPRPNAEGARAILGCHLPEGIPYASTQDPTVDARSDIIDAAVARIFAPNGHGAVARIVFRDGGTRPVTPRDLVSGAVLAQIARRSTLTASLRAVCDPTTGVSLSDVLDAIEREFASAAALLTPGNGHRVIDDIPPDTSIAKVEHVTDPLRRVHRYLEVA